MNASLLAALCVALAAPAFLPVAQATECSIGPSGCVCVSDASEPNCRNTFVMAKRCLVHAGPHPNRVVGFGCEPPE